MNAPCRNLQRRTRAKLAPRVSEDAVHMSILAYLRAVLLPPAKALHCPNGGLRTKREAAKLKAMGVLPGVPDILILAPEGRLYFAEVKTGQGRLSPEQQQFARDVLAMGFGWACVRSIDDMRAALQTWNVETCDAYIGRLV